VFCTDGWQKLSLIAEAKDYKRIGVGDTGLMTGGMEL
jgi:phosphoribosylamine-glycine ligase